MPWEWCKGKILSYLTIPEWKAEGVEIAFSNRLHGVSTGRFDSLNMGLHVGDEPEAVLLNRQLWLDEFDAGWLDAVVGEQVHGVQVKWVGAKDRGSGIREMQTSLAGIDGMLTREKIGLMAFFADCVPLFFHHPPTGIVAIAHAGWRGTIGHIGQKVLAMLSGLGVVANECRVAIGPGIGACCYEVDEFVAGQFKADFPDADFLVPGSEGRFRLDLQAANRHALLAAKVQAENIWMAELCTSCHPDLFFSHRGEGGSTGRMAGWIRRKDEVR